MQLAVLKSTLEAEQKEMAKKVNDLERRNVSEKERLKKEMLLKIKETKLSLLAMTEGMGLVCARANVVLSCRGRRPITHDNKACDHGERADDDRTPVPEQGNGAPARKEFETPDRDTEASP